MPFPRLWARSKSEIETRCKPEGSKCVLESVRHPRNSVMYQAAALADQGRIAKQGELARRTEVTRNIGQIKIG